MKQPLAHRRLFIRDRSPRDLVSVLRNEDQVRQEKLVDLDGTIHKGLYEPRLRGFTSADVALDLLNNWVMNYSFLRDNLRIFHKESGSLYEDIQGEERARCTRELVHMFAEVLINVDSSTLYCVMKDLPKRAFPRSKPVLQMVGGRTTMISCAMQMAVNSYGVHLNAERGLGNFLRYRGEGVSQGGKGIYGAEDKRLVAEAACKDRDRAIVFGDTLEDLGLAYAARKLSPDSVVVAMHGRSEELEEYADIVASSWEDLGMFMYTFMNDSSMPRVLHHSDEVEKVEPPRKIIPRIQFALPPTKRVYSQHLYTERPSLGI